MILNIFKKYTEISKRKKLIKTIITNLKISDKQKALYLDSMEILDEIGLEKLYKSLSIFLDEIESKEYQNIKKNNFSEISGIRKKEAQEKEKEVNTFNFLLNNL